MLGKDCRAPGAPCNSRCDSDETALVAEGAIVLWRPVPREGCLLCPVSSVFLQLVFLGQLRINYCTWTPCLSMLTLEPCHMYQS